MKKILLLMLVLPVVLWSGTFVFATGKGKVSGKQINQTKRLQTKDRPQIQKENAKKEAERGKDRAGEENKRIQTGKSEVKKEEKATGKEKDKADGPDKDTAKGKSPEKSGKGKEHLQQNKALNRQMLHEEAKYRKRQAYFKRIRELATKKDNKTLLERLKVLEAKEQSRYENKRKRMLEKLKQLKTGKLEPEKKSVEKNAVKGKEKLKTDAEKAKFKAKTEKDDDDKEKDEK